MCRLLGRVSSEPLTDADVIGVDGCAEFQRLGRLHADGWGTVWLEDGPVGSSADPATSGGPDASSASVSTFDSAPLPGGGRIDRLRDPGNPTTSRTLTDALVRVPARARVTHLRFATEGLATQLDNTHPFLVDKITFAHNGSVPVVPLRGLVTDEELSAIGGTTDSAMIFALILRRVHAGEPLFDAVIAVVAELRRLFPQAAINLLLLSSDELIAAHANAGATVPYAEFEASGLGDDLPFDHLDHYYRMSWRRTDDSVMITSSGLRSEGWTPIDQHTAVRIDVDTLAAEARTIPVLGDHSDAA
jgi:predicted glutamine amidotransferase